MSESPEQARPKRVPAWRWFFQWRRLPLTLGLLLVAWIAIQIGLTARYTVKSYGANHAEVAIVLGAAVIDDKPSPVFAERLNHAIQLYERNFVKRLILTGGYGEGDSRSESAVGAAYAIARGVPANRIVTESVSHTTKENLIEANRLMIEHGWKSALLVSDPLHMRRACTMAADLGIYAGPSPTTTSAYVSFGAQFRFLLRELYFQHHYWLFGE
jgi:uncharacterized SAM-binding protein YcdF (DUF218 family)